MNCPICGGKSQVVESKADCETVVRIRRCVECKHRFYTTELELDSSYADFREIRRPIERAIRARRKEAKR